MAASVCPAPPVPATRSPPRGSPIRCESGGREDGTGLAAPRRAGGRARGRPLAPRALAMSWPCSAGEAGRGHDRLRRSGPASVDRLAWRRWGRRTGADALVVEDAEQHRTERVRNHDRLQERGADLAEELDDQVQALGVAAEELLHELDELGIDDRATVGRDRGADALEERGTGPDARIEDLDVE